MHKRFKRSTVCVFEAQVPFDINTSAFSCHRHHRHQYFYRHSSILSFSYVFIGMSRHSKSNLVEKKPDHGDQRCVIRNGWRIRRIQYLIFSESNIYLQSTYSWIFARQMHIYVYNQSVLFPHKMNLIDRMGSISDEKESAAADIIYYCRGYMIFHIEINSYFSPFSFPCIWTMISSWNPFRIVRFVVVSVASAVHLSMFQFRYIHFCGYISSPIDGFVWYDFEVSPSIEFDGCKFLKTQWIHLDWIRCAVDIYAA